MLRNKDWEKDNGKVIALYRKVHEVKLYKYALNRSTLACFFSTKRQHKSLYMKEPTTVKRGFIVCI